jgi:hypothetical protein
MRERRWEEEEEEEESSKEKPSVRSAVCHLESESNPL